MMGYRRSGRILAFCHRLVNAVEDRPSGNKKASPEQDGAGFY
jgi:hypothetical protein